MSLLIREAMVSCILPVFDDSVAVSQSVELILAQTHRPIEIILINASSDDECAKEIRGLAAIHSEIRVFADVSGSVGAARELGRLNAKGEFIQYCDLGSRLQSDKFSSQVRALQRHPDCDVAYGKSYTQETVETGSTDIVESSCRETLAEDADTMFPHFLARRGWSIAMPLYRRQIVDKAGPWLDVICDAGWEYDCRIASLGGRLVFVDQFLLEEGACQAATFEVGDDYLLRLQHQVLVQAKNFRYAQGYMALTHRTSEISLSDWQSYSDAVFRLGRECALANLKTEARAMLSLSIEARGKKSSRHRLFLTLVKWLSWQKAAQTFDRLGK